MVLASAGGISIKLMLHGWVFGCKSPTEISTCLKNIKTNMTYLKTGKHNTGEGYTSLKNRNKLVWRLEGGQLNNFKSLLFVIPKYIVSYH